MNNCHESLKKKSLIIIKSFKNKNARKNKNVRGFIFDFKYIFSGFEFARNYAELFLNKEHLPS